MKTRVSDPCLEFLSISPSPEHLSITGCRLPTYEQVLLCFLANIQKETSCKDQRNVPVKRMAAKSTALEALVHYDKSKVLHRQIQNVENDILNFHEKEYRDLFKIKPNKRNGHPKVTIFKSKLAKTMPFWPKDCEELLEK